MIEGSIPAKSVLLDGLEQLGLTDATRIADTLFEYGRLLLEANLSTNLVGADTIEQLVTQHFLDSLAPLACHRFRPPVVDVGSGAGLPGIPIAIAHPRAELMLMEPRRLRAEFLRSVVTALGLANVTVLQGTAESAGRLTLRREQASTVMMRAIGKPAVAVELGLPLLKHGGELWLYRGRDADPEPAVVAAAAFLGGDFVSSQPVHVPFLAAQRHLWVFRKVRPTPKGYPRRSGIPDRSPLPMV
jgi:16S rRNA (guanine527-N7)-methyltransferase